MNVRSPASRHYIYQIVSGALWLFPLGLWLECALRPVAEPDIFFYFALVERYLKDHVWPSQDPFLFTLPDDYLMSLHQWLGYWLYYLPFRLLGWTGPILIETLFVGVLLSLPLLAFWRARRSPPFYFPLVYTLAVFTAHHRFRQRVSLFGDLFTVMLVCGLQWCSERRWFWWTLPGLFVAWAQLHPSYPLGWAILAGWFLTRRPATWTRRQLVSAVLCVLAPCLNPLGLYGVLYPFSFTLNVEPLLRQYVVEWLPLTDSRLYQFHFLYVSFVTLIPFIGWQLWRARAHTPAFAWLMFALGIVLNAKSVRFGLMAQGIFLSLLATLEAARGPTLHFSSRAWARAAALVIVGVLCAAVVVLKLARSSSLAMSTETRFDVDKTYFPEAAVNDINNYHLRLNVFNSFGFGGYLAWRWQGNPRIFFHGFSTNFKFYEDNYNKPQESRSELDRIIARYDLGLFLLSKLGNDNNFIVLLNAHPGWQKIREDDASVVFAKKDPRVFQ